ncbi:MAG TPA: hypothetical protein VM734_33200 [Kofleriaceae bacterium]|nr:hypothetical protein [Kofleriaceae bacterium]
MHQGGAQIASLQPGLPWAVLCTVFAAVLAIALVRDHRAAWQLTGWALAAGLGVVLVSLLLEPAHAIGDLPYLVLMSSRTRGGLALVHHGGVVAGAAVAAALAGPALLIAGALLHRLERRHRDRPGATLPPAVAR